MAEHEEIREWLLMTVQLMVDYPNEVTLVAVRGDQRTTLHIIASLKDRGKIIARQGRTSQPLRVLAAAMGKKVGWRFTIEIDEDKDWPGYSAARNDTDSR